MVKGAFTEGDLVPQRDLVFRISIDQVTGRASRF
jgi:hypothetical protein